MITVCATAYLRAFGSAGVRRRVSWYTRRHCMKRIHSGSAQRSGASSCEKIGESAHAPCRRRGGKVRDVGLCGGTAAHAPRTCAWLGLAHSYERKKHAEIERSVSGFTNEVSTSAQNDDHRSTAQKGAQISLRRLDARRRPRRSGSSSSPSVMSSSAAGKEPGRTSRGSSPSCALMRSSSESRNGVAKRSESEAASTTVSAVPASSSNMKR